MRSDKYIKEEKRKEEIKNRITATLLAFSLAVVSAGVVYKVEEDKMDTMRSYYEVLLEETNKTSYLQGFLDGLFGVTNNFFDYTDPKGEGLINTNDQIQIIEPEKALVLTKKINR